MPIKPMTRATASLVVLISIAACSDGGPSGPEPVATISISPPAPSVQVGATLQLTASARDEEGNTLSGRPFTWESLDGEIATVNGSGVVTGVTAGEATVRATSEGVTGTVQLTVTPIPVDSVEISPTDPTLQVGETVQLTATTLGAGGEVLTDRTVTWESSDSEVATVDESGLVTGIAEGEATVRATSEGVTGTAPVTVTPIPVVSIQVSPADPTLQVGETVQLSATTLDGDGEALTGRTVTWESSETDVATVDGNGLVTGIAAGTATITVSAEGIEASTLATVTSPASAAVVLTGVSPDSLVEGGSGTVTGSGFTGNINGNTVTIDGVAATVTAASATSLTFTVPNLDCRPARGVPVRVTVGGTASDELDHPLRPVSYMNMAVGEQAILPGPANLCVQFEETSNAEAYLIGVQSVSDVVSNLTSVVLTAETDPGAMSGMAARLPAPEKFAGQNPAARLTADERQRIERWRRHSRAEADLRAWERRWLQSRIARRTSLADRTATMTAMADVQTGDTVPMRVPDRSGEQANLCTDFNEITTVARAVGTQGIWLEDVNNPAGGYTSADFQSLSDDFDNRIFSTLIDYFGNPTDFDGNDRIVIVTTREVNKDGGILGFVSSGDLFPTSECAASNVGEVYYGIAPDPNGEFALGEYPVERARLDAVSLIPHEATHIIQLGRRLTLPGATAFQTSWEAEGQATLAEEVVGHEFTGRSSGQNYGFSVAFNSPETSDVSWYESHFSDLAGYYGFNFQETRGKISGAPEECSFLGQEGINGPCENASRLLYGVTWSFLRWVSDQFGPGYPGGEQGLHRDLIGNEFSGFETVEDVVGVPIEELLAQWAAMLYVDDRLVQAAPRLTMPSWNMTAIFGELIEEARLLPTERGFTDFSDPFSVRAASSAYFRVSGSGRPATSIRAEDASSNPLPSHMQLWIVRLR